jgi:hypothetical protein
MNVWHAQNFPFLTQLLFYENGTQYDQVRPPLRGRLPVYDQCADGAVISWLS